MVFNLASDCLMNGFINTKRITRVLLTIRRICLTSWWNRINYCVRYGKNVSAFTSFSLLLLELSSVQCYTNFYYYQSAKLYLNKSSLFHRYEFRYTDLPSLGGYSTACSTEPSIRILSAVTPFSTGSPKDMASPPPRLTNSVYRD